MRFHLPAVSNQNPHQWNVELSPRSARYTEFIIYYSSPFILYHSESAALNAENVKHTWPSSDTVHLKLTETGASE